MESSSSAYSSSSSRDTLYSRNAFEAGKNGSGPRSLNGVHYDPTSTKSLQKFVNHPDIKSKLLFSEGHRYIIDHQNSSFIFLPGGDETKIMSIKLYKPNLPSKQLYGKELTMAARTYMIAYDVIGPAQEQRIKDGKDPFKTIVIDGSTKSIRGYVSDYGKPGAKRRYVRRQVTTGTKIKNDKDIFKRIEKLREDKFEAEKAHQSNLEGAHQLGAADTFNNS